MPFPWGMLTPCHREGNSLGLGEDLPKVTQWDDDRATPTSRPLSPNSMPFCCTVLAPNQGRRLRVRTMQVPLTPTRAILFLSYHTFVPNQLSLLFSISSHHWLTLFWPHLAHSRKLSVAIILIQKQHYHHSQTVEHVLLLFSLGDKFEGPKQRSRQKPDTGDKHKDKMKIKNLSYRLRKMIYKIWNLN